MSFGNSLQLNMGVSIPQIGLGTWRSKPNEVENAVRKLPNFQVFCLSISLSLGRDRCP